MFNQNPHRQSRRNRRPDHTSLREMGIPSAAVYSDADRTSLHVRTGDEAYRSAGSFARELSPIDKLMDTARAPAAMPASGYGFLAEIPLLRRPALKRTSPSSALHRSKWSPGIENLRPAARRARRRAMVPGVQDRSSVCKTPSASRGTRLPSAAQGRRVGRRKGHAFVEEEPSCLPLGADAARKRFMRSVMRASIRTVSNRPRPYRNPDFRDTHGTRAPGARMLGQRGTRRSRGISVDLRNSRTAPRHGRSSVRLRARSELHKRGNSRVSVDAARTFLFLEVNTRLSGASRHRNGKPVFDLVKLQIRIAAGETLPSHRKMSFLRPRDRMPAYAKIPT